MKRTIALTATALAMALTLSACGEEDASTEQQPSAGESRPSGEPGRQPMPGSGLVAAVDGSTAQVQSSDSQVAVTWTDDTTFTQQVSAALSDVTVGSCVLVMGEATEATSVRITPAVDGECAAGMGGGGFGGGSRPTDIPTDRPTDMPSGAPGGMGGFTSGTVTAVGDSGFTVDAVQPGSDETTSTEVTVGSDTTLTRQAEAASSDVVVGVCLQTRGESDSTGAVAATSIAISAATDGECMTGRPR